MPSTKVSLSQMVDLALGTPEVGSVNFNVLHSLLHAMLKRLNIVDVQSDITDFDRDFLSAAKARELSLLSDVDSGRGEDTEDTISERSSVMPTPSTGRRTPYHNLEVKVAKLQEQLDSVTSVPSNKDLFNKAKNQYEEKPIGEMWFNMQLMSRVETNEKGIAKCMSMIEDMMKEMQGLKDANKQLMDKVSGLNIDELMKRLKDLEGKMKDMNDKFNLLPTPEDFAQFVTWAGLEDALNGIKKDWEDFQQQPERVVVEIASQTEVMQPSRANSAKHKQHKENQDSKSGQFDSESIAGYHSNSGRNHDQDSMRSRPNSSQSRGNLVKSQSDGGWSRTSRSRPSSGSDRHTSASRRNSQTSYEGNLPNNSPSKSSSVGKEGQRPKSVHYEYSENRRPKQSRPSSSRPGTRMSSGMSGPSETLLEILEKLGKLGDSHEALTKRVEYLEEEIKKKLDKDALDNFNLSADLLEQLQKLKEEVDALTAAREKSPVKTDLDQASHFALALKPSKGSDISVKASKLSVKQSKTGTLSVKSSKASTSSLVPSKEGECEVQQASSSELLLLQHEREMQAMALDMLQKKVEILEDRFKLFQEMSIGQNTYQQNVSSLQDWLTTMENRPDPLADLSRSSSHVTNKKDETDIMPVVEETRPVDDGSKRVDAVSKHIVNVPSIGQLPLKQELIEIFTKDRGEDMEEIGTPAEMVGDIIINNNKIKILAYVVNDQLHTIKDKLFTLDQDLKKMAKGIEFAMLRAKHEGGHNELDSDALSRAQLAIQQLQEEVEKLHGTTKDILEENSNRAKEIEKLFAYCDKLQETKADKEYVQAEVDVKADKRSLDNKVNHSLFDSTTNDINKMIKEILDKLAGNEEAWNHQCKRFADDIEGKLDRLELDPLKEWLESRLRALNEKLKKQNQAPVEWTDDDAAGIRRQLIQKFHCISCDRPVDIVPTGPVPSLPTHNGLHPTRSPRPYTTFELDQIRQHAKRMYAGIDRPGSRNPTGRNNINFERALAEKQLARMRKSDLKAFLVHFGQDIEALQQQREALFYANAEIADYYATTRPCGGQHTTTFPHKRITKLSHLRLSADSPSHLFREEEQTNIYPLYKEEIDVQGADGNIYKGRMDRIEAKLPIMTKERSIVQGKRDRSPQPQKQQITRVVRPTSAKPIHSPRPPSSKGGSRPQSAHPSASQHEVPGAESSHTTPVPAGSPEPLEDKPIEIPAQS